MRLRNAAALFAALALAGYLLGVALAVPATAIDIVDFAFQPATASGAAGAQVSWTNQGSVAHTVTFDTLSISSGTIAPGKSFSTALAQAGTYTYHCSFHPAMTGTITITDASPTLTPRLWLPLSLYSPA